MGQQFSEISGGQQRFIKEQKVFFVGTAAAEGKVNVSPKGMESLYVMNKNRVIWLNVTGSDNETAAHVQQNTRMTIMFVAFEGRPMIMRPYGSAKVIHPGDADWENCYPILTHFQVPDRYSILIWILFRSHVAWLYRYLIMLMSVKHKMIGQSKRVRMGSNNIGLIKTSIALMGNQPILYLIVAK